MKTLIVVDMQNDFIDGPLGTKEAVAILPKVAQKIDEYIKNGYQVIYTRDTHHDDYLHTHEGKMLPVSHCINESTGWMIHKDVERRHCLNVYKNTFGYLWWDEPLYYCGTAPEIEIVGVCTDICVISNALILRARYPESDITVDASCCAGTTPENHKAALSVMKSCQINIINE